MPAVSWIVGVLGFLLALVLAAILIALWYAIVFPRQPFQGPLSPLDADQRTTQSRLLAHLEAVARRPRNLDHYVELEAAANYIERCLYELGYDVKTQNYDVAGRPVRNLEADIGGKVRGANQPILIVGAHYDSPDDSPGANDNGSGVAATLELARLLRDLKPGRVRLRLVFWVNEEHPYGKTPAMGSWQHARALAERGETVAGVIALETLGYFSNKTGSQRFPRPFGAIYSNVGNFVAFVGLPGSRAFLHRAIRAFRQHAQFPSIGGVAPGFLEGIDLSDHWAYHQFGFPALMVTDTAPFRNPHYHTTTDLPETVDTESLARITHGLADMLRELAR
jgi:hypothetical protein